MNENKNLKIKVSYKLFHNSSAAPFATLSARVKGNRVALYNIRIDEDVLLQGTRGGVVHDWTLRNFRKEVTKAVKRLVADPDGLKFPYRWNEDTCLECYFQED